MTERRIFRNVQHVPKIWGVSYIKAFAALGAGLLITTAGFMLSGGSGIALRIMTLVLGAVITAALYGLCLWLERQDALDKDSSSFIKSRLNSQSLLNQRIRFKSTDSEKKEITKCVTET